MLIAEAHEVRIIVQCGNEVRHFGSQGIHFIGIRQLFRQTGNIIGEATAASGCQRGQKRLTISGYVRAEMPQVLRQLLSLMDGRGSQLQHGRILSHLEQLADALGSILP